MINQCCILYLLIAINLWWICLAWRCIFGTKDFPVYCPLTPPKGNTVNMGGACLVVPVYIDAVALAWEHLFPCTVGTVYSLWWSVDSLACPSSPSSLYWGVMTEYCPSLWNSRVQTGCQVNVKNPLHVNFFFF